MTNRLTPFGDVENAYNLAKVGKSKSPLSLADRLPRDLLAKVGGVKLETPASLAARMPSPEIAAKVGNNDLKAVSTRRVVRRSTLN